MVEINNEMIKLNQIICVGFLNDRGNFEVLSGRLYLYNDKFIAYSPSYLIPHPPYLAASPHCVPLSSQNLRVSVPHSPRCLAPQASPHPRKRRAIITLRTWRTWRESYPLPLNAPNLFYQLISLLHCHNHHLILIGLAIIVY